MILSRRGLAAQSNPVALDSLYANICALMRDLQPVTLLFPWSRAWAVHRRLRSLATPWIADPVAHMDRLWIVDE